MKKTLIERVELTSAASSITFSSIPQTYDGLLLVCSLRNSLNFNYFTLSFNGSTSNFTQRQLDGDGSTVSAAPRTDSIMRLAANTGNFTANTFASAGIYVPNYASSNNKSFSVDTVTETNATQSFQGLLACLWSQTAAISSIGLASPANFDQYSSASLYGITAGNDGTTTVS